METKELKCCFIGHRTIENQPLIYERLDTLLRALMAEYPLRVFLFGSRSQFDSISHQAVTNLKELYPDIVRIMYCCQSERACMESERIHLGKTLSRLLNRQIELQGYESACKFPNSQKAGRASYIERNKSMIDDSDVCIFYYDSQNVQSSKSKSGTAIAYEYAQKLSKKQNGKPKIINVFYPPDKTS